MDQIFELLTDLSVDPFLYQAFTRAPKDVLLQAGLASEDPATLSQAVSGGHRAPMAEGTWERCAVLVDPGFDPIDDTDPPRLTA